MGKISDTHIKCIDKQKEALSFRGHDDGEVDGGARG
jgi:hypothetical protein